jgi:arylsulfatase
MRQGRWKLVLKHPGKWELYDLSADRTETVDLAAKEPARVAEMAAQYERWAKRAGVMPWAEVQKAPRTPAPIPAV